MTFYRTFFVLSQIYDDGHGHRWSASGDIQCWWCSGRRRMMMTRMLWHFGGDDENATFRWVCNYFHLPGGDGGGP